MQHFSESEPPPGMTVTRMLQGNLTFPASLGPVVYLLPFTPSSYTGGSLNPFINFTPSPPSVSSPPSPSSVSSPPLPPVMSSPPPPFPPSPPPGRRGSYSGNGTTGGYGNGGGGSYGRRSPPPVPRGAPLQTSCDEMVLLSLSPDEAEPVTNAAAFVHGSHHKGPSMPTQ